MSLELLFKTLKDVETLILALQIENEVLKEENKTLQILSAQRLRIIKKYVETTGKMWWEL